MPFAGVDESSEDLPTAIPTVLAECWKLLEGVNFKSEVRVEIPLPVAHRRPFRTNTAFYAYEIFSQRGLCTVL